MTDEEEALRGQFYAATSPRGLFSLFVVELKNPTSPPRNRPSNGPNR
jgi:hypothetical protein